MNDFQLSETDKGIEILDFVSSRHMSIPKQAKIDKSHFNCFCPEKARIQTCSKEVGQMGLRIGGILIV